MLDPYLLLGIKPTSTAEEIRHAYHLQAKKWHPDKFQDPEQQKQAQDKMTLLNLAYQEAMRLANARQQAPYHRQLSCEDAIKLSQKMMNQGYPEGALRELLRSDTRTPRWFYQQGLVLMAMEQWESAHQSFREAVRRDPANNVYRSGALEAELALRKSKTFGGKVHKLIRRLQKK